MLTRSRTIVGFSAILSSLAFVASASAQNANLGRRIENQILNSVMSPGTQPMYYGAGQPYYSPYAGQTMGYPYAGQTMGYAGQTMGYGAPMYQPQAGTQYNQRGLPFIRRGRNAYQQAGGVYNQQAATIQTQPSYDQQLQPTSYSAPTGQRYQIPAQYAGTPAGYVINYGGRSYLSGSDGTMTPYNGPVAPR